MPMAALGNTILKYKSWLIAILVIAGTAQLSYTWYQNKNKPAVNVRTAAVERGDLISYVSA